MAHNYYRIPLRIRFKSLLELQPSEPEVLLRSKCRKHRRKIRFLLNHYERRQREFKWMETHIWHAKRFAMEDLWGFKVPYKSRDKSCRTVYKLSQRDSACIVDQSYYRTLRVGLGAEEDYQKALSLLSLKELGVAQQRNILYDEDKTLMCPVTALTLVHAREVLVVVHPSAFFDFQGFLASHQLKSKELFLNNFQMISQNCNLHHIYNVFHPLSAGNEDSRASLSYLQEIHFD